MEINGYEIEEYNIYSLDTKAKKSTCPKCSHTRKKKTQKCLMLDWDRGLGTCQHCGEVLQLHTYKTTSSQSYIRPVQIPTSDMAKIYQWFSKRGISRATVYRYINK